MSQGSIALIIVGVMLVMFITQLFPLEITAMLAAFAMAFTGIIDFKTVLSEFGTSNTFCVAGMMVVGAALFETGLAQFICSRILGKSGHRRIVFLATLLTSVTVFSSFLSNTTTTAMFLPVVAGVAANPDFKKTTVKNTYILVGYAAGLGGCMTLLGSPTQHQLANSVLENAGFASMGFFYGVRGTLVLMIIMILYFILLGDRIMDKKFNFEDVDKVTEVKETERKKTAHEIYKMIMSGVIMLGCIVSIAMKRVSSGAGALIGAVACVVFGCIDSKTAAKKINLNVVILLAGLFAVSDGFNISGAGQICVDAVFSLFGENTSPHILYAIVVMVSVLLTNVIDNIAAQALIAPIALAIALRTGINPTVMVFSVLAGCNVAYLTPISTPCITMTLDGGYRFRDYLTVGWPLSLLSYLGIIVLFPLIYGF